MVKRTPYRKGVSKMKDKGLSKHVGVSWHSYSKSWICFIRIDGKKMYLGHYLDEEKATRMYDERAAHLGKPVNFPQHEGMKKAVKRAYNRREKNKKKPSPEDIDGSNSEADPEPKRQKTDS